MTELNISKTMNEEVERYAYRFEKEGCREVKDFFYPTSKNFIADSLNEKGLIECLRLFYSEKLHILYCVVSFGDHMCGHNGILHGGASAAVLDQFFGFMTPIQGIKAFTGDLHLSYRKIILCPSTVLITGEFVKSEGRKQYYSATITDTAGDVCVKADCLCIESDVDSVLKRAREHNHLVQA